MDRQIFLALGSNIGNVRENLYTAVALVRNYFNISKSSSLYSTKPYGNRDQDVFVNMVIVGDTDLKPVELLTKILSTEKQMGRTEHKKWAARIIDIDILFWDHRIIDRSDLKIPHYDYKNRDFFLLPAAEIAPEFTPPGSKYALSELIKKVSIHTIIEKENMVEPIYRH